MPAMARYDPFSPTFDHPLLNSSPDYGSRNGTFRARPIGDLGGQVSFRERNKRLKQLEDEKNQLIEDLLYQLESTQNQLGQLQIDHSREIQYNREGRVREDALHGQLQQAKAVMDRDPFIIVLIDGDGLVFTKDLLSNGEKGGREAATALWNSIYEFATENLAHLTSPKIMVRIYANVKALSEGLLKSKLIDQASLLDDFLRGFNSTKLLFDFVDAGTRKDSTGDKLSELYRQNLYNCHCHQVIIGCSHNNEYARLLQETMNDPSVLGHVTLLEGPPFEKDLAALQSNFKTTRFDNVFRNTKLGPSPALLKAPLQPITAALPALSRVESNKTNGSGSTSSTPQMNWATVTAQAFVPAPTPPKTIGARTPTPGSITNGEAALSKPSIVGIERNRSGHRIDKVDSAIPAYEIQRIKKLKLCNIFYLQGPSFCTSSNCSHSHSYPLSKGEKNVLREVARMTPCYYKMDCEDPSCIYGHRCPQSKPNEPGCYYGEDCRFWGWGHGIDTRVVKTTKV